MHFTFSTSNFWIIGAIVSSVLYIAMLIFVPMLWPSYDSVSQTVSELSAVDAPTRTIWVVPSFVYSLLVIGFGYSIMKTVQQKRNARIAGTFIFIYGFLSMLWPFAPMHQREYLAANGETITDTLHLVLAGLTVFVMTAAIAFAASAFGKPFLVYSVFTILALLVFGILTSIDAPKVKSNLPTPWIGVWERINILVFLLWIVTLAYILLRRQRAGLASLR